MASVNKVFLIGNLGAEPETRCSAAGDAVCNLRLATSEKWRDKTSGESHETTEWHRVVLHRRLAEVAGQYLRKGSPVYIEGRLRTRKWMDKDGRERNTTEIEATAMQMLYGGAKGSGVAYGTISSQPQLAKPSVSEKDPWEDGATKGEGNLFEGDGEYPF